MNLKNQSQANEMFAIPYGLELAAKIEGIELYTSDKLKEKYIESMRSTTRTEPVIDKIEELINRKLIIPCFMNKNIFKFITFKLFSDRASKSVMGFFDTKSKKIYMLIDNNINPFGFSSNDWLAVLTIHESVHMFSNHKPSKFRSLFSPELKSYYQSAFNNIFQLEEGTKIKNIDKIVDFIFHIEQTKKFDNKIATDYLRLLRSSLKQYSVLDSRQFDKNLVDYIVIINIYSKDLNTFINSIRSYKHIIGPLYIAYQESFNMGKLYSICIQELITPSEIICIYSEFGPPNKIYSAIKQI